MKCSGGGYAILWAAQESASTHVLRTDTGFARAPAVQGRQAGPLDFWRVVERALTVLGHAYRQALVYSDSLGLGLDAAGTWFELGLALLLHVYILYLCFKFKDSLYKRPPIYLKAYTLVVVAAVFSLIFYPGKKGNNIVTQ